MEWVESPAYDPAEIKATYAARRMGSALLETILARE
jgi:hypothetical protein